MRSVRVCRWAILSVLLWLVGCAGGAAAESLERHETLQPGEYLFVRLVNPDRPDPWVIDVTWVCYTSIDVWVMDSANFELYQRGSPFTFDLENNFASPHMEFTVTADRFKDEPFYLVFDHAFSGRALPYSGPAEITVSGETRSVLPPGLPVWILIVAAFVAIASVGAIFVIRERAANRKADGAAPSAGETLAERGPPRP